MTFIQLKNSCSDFHAGGNSALALTHFHFDLPSGVFVSIQSDIFRSGRTPIEREFSKNQKVVRRNDNNLFKEVFLVNGYVHGHDLCELIPLSGGKLQVEYPDKLEAI